MRLTLLEITRLLGCDPASVLPDGINPALDAADVESALGARIIPTGAQIDSRLIAPKQLFFCLKGENADGHDFAAAAARAGASAVIAERPPFAPSDTKAPVFLVPDVAAALARLGRAGRARMSGKVVGVTGSAGKTSVKEVLARVLAVRGQTARNHMNLNNNIGLPLSMLNASAEAVFWVLEAGISEPGDMDELGAILRPDFGLVLNAGAAHTQGLGDKGTAHYKAKLLRYMRPGGQAFVCADYPDLVREARLLTPVLATRSVELHFFSASGQEAMCKARYLGGVSSTRGLFLVQIDGKELRAVAPFRGVYGAENIAACVAVAYRAGLTFEEIAKGLETAELPAQRFSQQRRGECLIIDDTYNANPLSTGRMVEAAAGLAEEEHKPLLLVMGEMLELGDVAEESHEHLGEQMAQVGPKAVFWKGGMVDAVRRGLARGGYAGAFYPVGGGQEFSALLDEIPVSPGVILFKGSRSNKLERLVAVLCDALPEAGGN